MKVVITDKRLSDDGNSIILSFEFAYGGNKYKSSVEIPLAALHKHNRDKATRMIIHRIRRKVKQIIGKEVIEGLLKQIPDEIEV